MCDLMTGSKTYILDFHVYKLWTDHIRFGLILFREGLYACLTFTSRKRLTLLICYCFRYFNDIFTTDSHEFEKNTYL